VTWEKADLDVVVGNARDGDDAALEELMRRHRPRLQRMIRHRLDPRMYPRVDESEVLQETQIAMSGAIDNYVRDESVPFYAWLRQIAWRQLLRASERHLKTGRRSVMKEQNLNWNHSRSALTEQLLDLSTPSKDMIRAELSGRVSAALDSISETDREVLVLRFLEQLSAKEAAAVQGISEAASRQRLTRALERLGKQLNGFMSSCSEGKDDEGHREN
jgi:RNA polymerase sigma-70 factor (ECF subfamily)